MEIGYSENEKQIAKSFILEGLPLTMIGLVLWFLGRTLLLGMPPAQYVADVIIVGAQIWMLVAWYYLGKGALLITNKIISRFTSELRSKETEQ